MSQLDTYHRAFLEYRKETSEHKLCKAERKRIIKLCDEFDILESTKYLCTIDEDWVKAIEEGLEFVEKAVREDRQFIRVNGEVVPIEKAKKVSKYSVEHLAKHSEMITHVPEDGNMDNIVPDAIYMVEKLNDYAVYENRVLYMLLCYLRDFIALRLDKISKLRTTYICDFKLKKDFESKKRNYNYETFFHDERYDNPYPLQDKLSEDMLVRIENCQQIVIMLLNTDLMIEVSKAPMVKPPIIKTNVLKMNNNFKKSLALYDYIVSYKGDGYTAEAITKNFVPFGDIVGDEIAELVTVTSYLTYKYGNEITDILDLEYEKEEERRKAEERQKLQDQIIRLRKRVMESGQSLEEYLLLLEKRNRLLEEDSHDLIIAKNEIVKLQEEINQLNLEMIELNRKISVLEEKIKELNAEIARLNQKYIDDMNAIKNEHAREVSELINKYTLEISNLETAHQNEINELMLKHQDELQELEASLVEKYEAEIEVYQNKLDDLNTTLTNTKKEYRDVIENHEAQIRSLDETINNKEKAQAELIVSYDKKLADYERECTNRIDEVIAAHNLTKAELRSMRFDKGLEEARADLTSRERFGELETEFEAFNKFFKEQWNLTKKEIRRQLIWHKGENKQRIKAKSKKEFTNEEPLEETLAEVQEETTLVEPEKVEETTAIETEEVKEEEKEN